MLSDEQKEKLAQHAKDNAMPGTTARPRVEGQPLHIDGDYMAYYCAGNDDTTPGEARARALERIERGMQVTGSTRCIVHLSTDDCDKALRYIVTAVSPTSKPYQGQRSSGRKPQNWRHLRDWMEDYSGERFVVKNWRDREADDGMAYVAESSYKIGRPGAVMTADKDMRMFAGLHVVWKTFELVEVLPGTYDLVRGGLQYGHKWFWQQMVQGDGADNIVGIPKCGEIAALQVTEGTSCNQEAYERVIDLYRSKMKDDYADHFVAQAMLLWMRTDANADLLDFMKMPGITWERDIIRASSEMVRKIKEHPAYVR